MNFWIGKKDMAFHFSLIQLRNQRLRGKPTAQEKKKNFEELKSLNRDFWKQQNEKY